MVYVQRVLLVQFVLLKSDRAEPGSDPEQVPTADSNRTEAQ